MTAIVTVEERGRVCPSQFNQLPSQARHGKLRSNPNKNTAVPPIQMAVIVEKSRGPAHDVHLGQPRLNEVGLESSNQPMQRQWKAGRMVS